MPSDLSYWRRVYYELLDRALCLDVEVTHRGGPLSVVGLYKPQNGLVQCAQLVKGRDLDGARLQTLLERCKLLITFNGLSFDVPHLKREFPDSVPSDVKVIDLYRFAQQLNLKAGLKTIENTFGVERLDERTARRGIATKLWRQYYYHGNARALDMLLEYNKQDTVNLYPIAERMMGMVG